jgi:2-desacetyl-2-hydroxyethyl bacteriochlorophyllide A dehydrogenase
MEWMESERPSSLGQKEVLIAIKRVGICGTDIHAYGGNQPFFEYPRILGHELSGVIEAVGEGVERLQDGDRVSVIPYLHCGTCISCRNGKTNCCTDIKVVGVHVDGGLREYLVMPESHVLKVNDLTLEEAAIIEPLSIGAHAVRRADVTENDTVLVIGAGPIGLGVAKLSKLKGAKTIIMDISDERLAFCKEWAGCDAAVNAANGEVEQALRAVNNGDLPTIVLDATGNKMSMESAFQYASHGGKLVYVGLIKDTISFHDPSFHAKELTLMGSRNATKEDFNLVMRSIASGEISAASYITHTLTFEEVADYFQKGDFRTNKALIKVAD